MLVISASGVDDPSHTLYTAVEAIRDDLIENLSADQTLLQITTEQVQTGKGAEAAYASLNATFSIREVD